MNLLLDTHALLWWLADDAALSDAARAAIADPRNLVYVSAASAWEIAIKRALGKLEAPADLSGAVSGSGFLELPISMSHAQAAGALPDVHGDPFDRMLVAQAQQDRLTIVTRDERTAQYGVATIPA